MATALKKTKDAPDTFHPEVQEGDTFEHDYDAATVTAVVAAGWAEPATAKKKEEK